MAAYLTAINNLSNLPTVTVLSIIVNRLTDINLLGNNITTAYLQNNLLTSLDLTSSDHLNEINIGGNSNLATFPLPDLSFCLYFNAGGCALSTSTIDAILIALDEGGNEGSYYCFLDSGTNGIPTASGIAAGDSLTSKGWTVTYNT